jgi:hypothetical protein
VRIVVELLKAWWSRPSASLYPDGNISESPDSLRRSSRGGIVSRSCFGLTKDSMNNALETVMKSRLASKGHKLEVHEGRLQDTLARQLRSVEENALLDHRERGLDKTLADSFPCSDPLSSIPNPTLRN